jgi:hypothetical protein
MPPGNIVFRFLPDRVGCPTLFPTLSNMAGDDDRAETVVEDGNAVDVPAE